MKSKRETNAIAAYVKQRSDLDARNRTGAAEPSRSPADAAHAPVQKVICIAPADSQRPLLRDISDLQDVFRSVAGEDVNLHDCPDAWLLLAAWEEKWCDLTNPEVSLDPVEIITLRAEMLLLLDLMGTYQAISIRALEASDAALDAVIESRFRIIKMRSGKDEMTIRIDIRPDPGTALGALSANQYH